MATGFLPLEGVRVIDVTSSLAGPYCTACYDEDEIGELAASGVVRLGKGPAR